MLFYKLDRKQSKTTQPLKKQITKKVLLLQLGRSKFIQHIIIKINNFLEIASKNIMYKLDFLL